MWQKLNFATLCLHVKESGKACEESGKACKESGKAPCENTSKPPFWKTCEESGKAPYDQGCPRAPDQLLSLT